MFWFVEHLTYLRIMVEVVPLHVLLQEQSTDRFGLVQIFPSLTSNDGPAFAQMQTSNIRPDVHSNQKASELLTATRIK